MLRLTLINQLSKIFKINQNRVATLNHLIKTMKQPKMWKEVNRNKNRKNKEVNKSIKDYQNYKESIKLNNKKDKKEKIKFQRNRRKS